MKIHTVTVTGADDTVLHDQLVRIAERYPYVEFAVLLSRRYLPEGTVRFPSANWLRKLVELPSHVKLAGHICGQWVQEIYQGNWPKQELTDAFGTTAFFERIGRWQLNTHGRRYKASDAFYDSLSNGPRTVIFQDDGKNYETIAGAISRGITNVASLFDLSHGTGMLPESWPHPLHGIDCGYAGGLSPENVKEQCQQLSKFVRVPIWIDAETKLRSDKFDFSTETLRDSFDLEKVQNFLSEAKEFTQ